MRILACSLFFGMVLASQVLARNAQLGDPVIISPRLGDVLQGVVSITGSTDVSGFFSAEVSFIYADDPNGVWSLIAMSSQPVFNESMAAWDTTVITDGEYGLRLRVYLTDGSSREALVSGLRVRNYTPVEPPTPIALAPDATRISTVSMTATPFPTPTALDPELTPLLTITPTATPFPTPTAFPHNPAALAPTDVSASILYGGMAALLIFVIVGIYLWLRRKLI